MVRNKQLLKANLIIMRYKIINSGVMIVIEE